MQYLSMFMLGSLDLSIGPSGSERGFCGDRFMGALISGLALCRSAPPFSRIASCGPSFRLSFSPFYIPVRLRVLQALIFFSFDSCQVHHVAFDLLPSMCPDVVTGYDLPSEEFVLVRLLPTNGEIAVAS